jgi:tRNA pseudouridine32 synthase / 23S rRNA pseudouridine746 synthase
MTFQTQRLSDNVFNCNASSDIDNQIINYWYEGYCPNTGKLLGLPRTHQIEAIARDLMNSLAEDPIFSREGKMYGVLLGETQRGDQVLKAFSGLLQGQSEKEGWVPPISGKEKLVLAENQTLAELEQIKQQILQWQFIPERQEYESLYQDFSQHLADLNLIHSQRKEERKKQRECLLSLETSTRWVTKTATNGYPRSGSKNTATQATTKNAIASIANPNALHLFPY